MDIFATILSWVGSHWDYIVLAYLAGAAGNTSSGRWLVRLPIRPVAWAATKLSK